ncbi:membrane protein insertase YidC [Agromyces sp. Soil535]|uniref:YidC/Oxa1 family membrane protein insertase n=1 Tax=Agromyces sp. Soil535 TaxID=1736390 RepID=UPI0006FCD013|nr:membrane protein insertase YidC [Agromyces sp. Soil535]KRE21087.1 preprotein translocase YidC [Agromyces sp. Soil535]
MDLYAFPPLAALLDGAHALLMGLADVLQPLAGTSSAAAAVVLVTLLVRTALIPVGISQAKAERTRARLAPRLAELRRRHANDPERLQRETMALYAADGTSPFAGCLPLLIQAPIVGVIYALFILPTIAGHPNALLEQTLFGVPLGSSLAGSIAAGTLTPGALAVFGVVIVSIALVGELTRRAFRPRPAGDAAPASAATRSADAAKSPDPAALLGSAAMVRMLGLLQFLTAVVAVFVPLAAALYLLVTVAWTLGQRLVLRRTFPLPPALPA